MKELTTGNKPEGGIGTGLGTGLPNDVDYCDLELKVLQFLHSNENKI